MPLTIYRCEGCLKEYKTLNGVTKHEKTCLYMPAMKTCLTCVYKGLSCFDGDEMVRTKCWSEARQSNPPNMILKEDHPLPVKGCRYWEPIPEDIPF